ncbi:MAG TPA: sigma-70 family RNA polymerase sigma factor [Dinghuibacter sp.]|uniref:RNA polymerase sigma factor n=1 Tax=Dinghuibacter sp. TaxID=2024697 RepID=UPI002D124891|nr:sigma-70 family RNA polymerase sigma factor [Dinghuibacter sp.]HTJ12391.1 sigma-70 family RNA polymerase sigma factor [Dinghuibacter sp.]
MQDVRQLVDHLFRREAGKMVSILTRLFGLHNLELVEDIVQDTHQQALLDWSCSRGLPDNPAGWLMTVARRKAINAIRREARVRSFAVEVDALLKSDWTVSFAFDNVFLESEIFDSQLRMIFTCCHPSLPVESQVALTLRTLCGFSVGEIASALLTTEANVNKRLYRAREGFRTRLIDFAVPSGASLPARLDAVLLVLYLLFNEGYHSSGDFLIRKDLCLEAMRLAMLLMDRPDLKGYPQTPALLALMCFHSARFDARVDGNECLVLLEEQDRSRWDRDLIGEGLRFLSLSAVGSGLSAFHLEAAIAAEHCLAPSFPATNWEKIYDYYTALHALKPSAVIRMNMAIVRGMISGPLAAIPLLLGLLEPLASYPLLYASLGEFYFQCGDFARALECFLDARRLTKAPAVIEVLDRKMRACTN